MVRPFDTRRCPDLVYIGGNPLWTLAIVFLLGAMAIVQLAGCANVKVDQEEALPFTVALIPVIVDDGWNRDVEDASKLDIKLSLAEETMADRIMAKLRERCFVRVIALDRPPDMTSETASDRHYEQQAKNKGADLLIECRLRYSPEVHTRASGVFWYNFAVHQIGGPFCYWVNDRSYLSPADLEIQIHDVQSIDANRTLSNNGAQVLTVNTEYEGTDLNFNDRNSNPGNYILSLIVPVGLMAHENEKIRARLEDEVVYQLATRIAEEIRQNSKKLLLADRVTRFFIEPGGVRAVREPNGKIALRGSVLLRRREGTRDEKLDRFRWLTSNARYEDCSFEEAVLDEQLGGKLDKYFRYPLSELIETKGHPETLQITVWDSNDFPRSFTIAVEDPAPSSQKKLGHHGPVEHVAEPGAGEPPRF